MGIEIEIPDYIDYIEVDSENKERNNADKEHDD